MAPARAPSFGTDSNCTSEHAIPSANSLAWYRSNVSTGRTLPQTRLDPVQGGPGTPVNAPSPVGGYKPL